MQLTAHAPPCCLPGYRQDDGVPSDGALLRPLRGTPARGAGEGTGDDCLRGGDESGDGLLGRDVGEQTPRGGPH